MKVLHENTVCFVSIRNSVVVFDYMYLHKNTHTHTHTNFILDTFQKNLQLYIYILNQLPKPNKTQRTAKEGSQNNDSQHFFPFRYIKFAYIYINLCEKQTA